MVNAHAELADRDKPINIESNKMTADDNKKVTYFEGHVVLTQGTIRLTADRMTVREDAAGFKYASAYGEPVTFRQKREGLNEWVDGVAQHAEYDGKIERIELFEKALVRREKDEIRGNYLAYDMKTEFMQGHGTPAPSTAPNSSSGRVHVILQPQHDKTDTSTAPAQPASQILKQDNRPAP
jgi:lipopolysaccharide export system protein LptA